MSAQTCRTCRYFTPQRTWPYQKDLAPFALRAAASEGFCEYAPPPAVHALMERAGIPYETYTVDATHVCSEHRELTDGK